MSFEQFSKCTSEWLNGEKKVDIKVINDSQKKGKKERKKERFVDGTSKKENYKRNSIILFDEVITT